MSNYERGNPRLANYVDFDRSKDQAVATSLLQQRANDIRMKRVNWQSYLQGQMISNDDYQFITQFDNSIPETRARLLKDNPTQCARTFLNLMGHISKDQTVQFILTMIDDMLQEDMARVEIFRDYAKKTHESVWGPFLNMLNRPDGFIVNQTSRIVSKIACWSRELMTGSDLRYYLIWLKDQMRVPGNEYLQTVARCLQMMLRIDEYRLAFVEVDGISTVMSILAGKVSFQLQYQLTFCIWCLTFNKRLSEKLSEYNVIPILADILSESAKEKVTRIILATFRNLIEKPEDKDVRQDYALAMVQCKVLKQLSLVENRKHDDPDIQEDVEFLTEFLHTSVRDLSSFDEYCTEVKSGRLEWSPVHKEERFWRENAMRFNDKGHELLKILIKLMETSRDPMILSVAAHDIGEYVRHYPRGKHVIEQLGGKQMVMKMLTHDDPNVRYEALLAVQKIMVHNWEYLSRTSGV